MVCENRTVTLERVLSLYSSYDHSVGYVQGLNFLAAGLLFHAEEHIAFWLMDYLLEKLDMKSFYYQGKSSKHSLQLKLSIILYFLIILDFPGLKKHYLILDMLILLHLREIYSKIVLFFFLVF